MIENAPPTSVRAAPAAAPYQVFLSHDQTDRAWVTEFSRTLREAGVNQVFDAGMDIAPGDDWRMRIEEALRDSRMLVLILNEESAQSPWIQFEVGAAVADRKVIIPVVHDEIEPAHLPPLLRRYQVLREPSARQAGLRVAEVIDRQSGR